MLARFETFLTFVASQCMPSSAGASPTTFDYALTATLFLLVLYALYALLRGMIWVDTAANEAVKTKILND